MKWFLVVFLLAIAGSTGAAATGGPKLVQAPSAIGAPVPGQRLTAEPGSWSGTGTVAFAYQWYRCDAAASHCSSIHGATSQSYQIVAADSTHTIGLTVKATDSTGTTSAYAPIVGPVGAATSALVSTVQPIATATVKVGDAVQVGNGAWSSKPASFTYAWMSCNANGRICTPIAAATTSSYTTTTANVGHALVALVTATSGSATASALSTTATVVAATATTPSGGPSNTQPPTVTGSAEEGVKLVGAPGNWTGTGTIYFSYQWYRCDATGSHCSSIHGAIGGTYTLVSTDVAHTIGLTVNATDPSGKAAAYASLIGPIAQHSSTLVSSAQPAISGTPKAGEKLTVSNGTWTAKPTAFHYAWQRCNANGRLCTPIASATAATYTVTADDADHQLLAVVEADVGASSAQALSKAVLAQ